MSIKKIGCAVALSIAAAFPLSSYATASPVPQTLFEGHFSDVLYPKAKLNKNLDEGEYDFLGLHHKQGKSFVDEWKFTLADTSNVVISLEDYELSLGNAYTSKGKKHSSGYLVDNKLLTFSLFDANDNLLGTAGEDGTVSALGLDAGVWYTIVVSAKVNGVFGSAYHGTLAVSPAVVPLTDTLPFFASAMLVLAGAKRRKSNAA